MYSHCAPGDDQQSKTASHIKMITSSKNTHSFLQLGVLMLSRKIVPMICTSFLLTCAAAPVHAMPKNRKLNATELLTALQKQETRSRAAISGWNTRIRRQIARRATQELAALQTANLAHEICQNENVERTRLVQNYELESRNIEAARQCQICLEQYGTQHPIFPSVCPCKARLCVECAEAAFANNQPRCPFCAQDLETTQLLHTICNLRMAENLLNQDEAAHIMQCEWQLARYALNLVPEPAISDSDDDPLMAPHLNNHVRAIQSD